MNKCEWKDGKFVGCEKHSIKLGAKNHIDLEFINFCPFCGADIRKPEANPVFSDFLDQVMEALSIDKKIPIEILKMKFSPDYVKWIGAKRPSIDPVKEGIDSPELSALQCTLRPLVNKETYKQWCGRLIRDTESIKEPPEITLCSQCGCAWPAGHNYCPECAKPLISDSEDIKEADCENCDHPAECEECLAEFNARVTRKELSVAAKIFTDNVKLAEENDALKKLFIAEHREKAELLQSIALYKSREERLLRKTEELKTLCSSEEIMNLRLDLSEALIKIKELEASNG